MVVLNCNKYQQVENMQEASKIIRQTIDKKGMGSTKWYGYKDNGSIMHEGIKIGYISYNGRIWEV